MQGHYITNERLNKHSGKILGLSCEHHHCESHHHESVSHCGCQYGDYLTSYSPRDKSWDIHRSQARCVQDIYASSPEFQKYANRIRYCARDLVFAEVEDKKTGEVLLKLRQADFCRVRHCPICQWRRSLMWKARFYKALPDIVEQFPESRWVFLTLTARNCQISSLREQLDEMNKAWLRLIKLKEFRAVQGWIRTTEVTKGKDESAHPHFHVLLMVSPSWFSTDYVKQSQWAEIWGKCMRLDYTPIVDIRAVKPKKTKKDLIFHSLKDGVAELLKYSIKPRDMVSGSFWFLEMTRQVHKKRFISSGGVLKNILRDKEETNEDLALVDDSSSSEQGPDIKLHVFAWVYLEERYRKYISGGYCCSSIECPLNNDPRYLNYIRGFGGVGGIP